MTGPAQLAYPLAAIMIAVAAYCAARLAAAPVTRRPAGSDADLVHIAMSVAMAGMLIPRLNPLLDGGWVVIFAASAAWFAWRTYHQARRRGAAHHALHLVHSAAMIYMLVATSSATQPLGIILGLALLGCTIWDIDLLSAPAHPAQMLAPHLARLCRIALGITMSYVLICIR